MTSPEPSSVLDALISKWRLTKDKAAKLVTDAGCPVSGRHLTGIARWERQPGTEMTGAIERAYGLPIDELLTAYSGQWLPSTPPSKSTSASSSPTTQEAFALAAQRAYQYKLAYQTRIDTSALADDVRHLAVAYPQQPLSDVISPLVSAQEAVYEQLNQGSLHTDSARDLHFLAGVTTGMIAKAAHDSGNPARAVELARSAMMAGELAGHRSLQAWVSGLLALVTYWAGRPQESIRHARRAAHFADGSFSTVPVWAAVSEARAWSQLGNADEVTAALQHANTVTERASGDDLDELGGLFTFPHARALYYSAEATVTVGLTNEAVRYGTNAVAAYRDPASNYWAFGDAAGATAALATARIGQGEIEGASELLVPVFNLPPSQRINGIIKCIQPVYEAVTSTDTGEAGQDLGEQIEAFTRVPMRAVTQ